MFLERQYVGMKNRKEVGKMLENIGIKSIRHGTDSILETK